MKTISVPFYGATIDSISQTYHGKHPALDMVCSSKTSPLGYGTPLTAPEDCEVLRITGDTYTPGSSGNLKRGYGIYLTGLETGCTHFFWHTLPIMPVNVGQKVSRGKIVAFMGNAGAVYSNDNYVPLSERTTPPYNGTHLHWEMMGPGYIFTEPKNWVNPLDYIDWGSFPAYSNYDFLKASSVVLGKIVGLVS